MLVALIVPQLVLLLAPGASNGAKFVSFRSTPAQALAERRLLSLVEPVVWVPGMCRGTTTVDSWRADRHTLGGWVSDGPLDYWDNMDCRWHLRVPTGTIRLDFTEFAFTPNEDYLYVYDGGSAAAPLLLKADGVAPAPVSLASLAVASNGPELYIRITSDRNANRNGFNATWTNIEAPAQCVACARPARACALHRQCPLGYSCEWEGGVVNTGATPSRKVCTASSFGVPCTTGAGARLLCTRGLVCLGGRCGMPRLPGDACSAAAAAAAAAAGATSGTLAEAGCGPHGGRCVPKGGAAAGQFHCVSHGALPLGRPCSASTQCAGYENGTLGCRAPDGAAPNTTLCLPPAGPGEPCISHLPPPPPDSVSASVAREAKVIVWPPVNSAGSAPTMCALDADGVSRLQCRDTTSATLATDPTPAPTPGLQMCLKSVIATTSDADTCNLVVDPGICLRKETTIAAGAGRDRCKLSCYLANCSFPDDVYVARRQYTCFRPLPLHAPCDVPKAATSHARFAHCAPGAPGSLGAIEGGGWRHDGVGAYTRRAVSCVAGGLVGAAAAAVPGPGPRALPTRGRCTPHRVLPPNANASSPDLCASGYSGGPHGGAPGRCLPPPSFDARIDPERNWSCSAAGGMELPCAALRGFTNASVLGHNISAAAPTPELAAKCARGLMTCPRRCNRTADCVPPAYDAAAAPESSEGKEVSGGIRAAFVCSCDLGEAHATCKDLRANNAFGGAQCTGNSLLGGGNDATDGAWGSADGGSLWGTAAPRAGGGAAAPRQDQTAGCCAAPTLALERCIGRHGAVVGAAETLQHARDVAQAREWLLSNVEHQLRYPYDGGVALMRHCLPRAFAYVGCALKHGQIEFRRCVADGARASGVRVVSSQREALEALMALAQMRAFAGPDSWAALQAAIGYSPPPPCNNVCSWGKFEWLLFSMALVGLATGGVRWWAQWKRARQERVLRKKREEEERLRLEEEARLEAEAAEHEEKRRLLEQLHRVAAAKAAAVAAAMALAAALDAEKAAVDAKAHAAAVIPMSDHADDAEREQVALIREFVEDGVHHGHFGVHEVSNLRDEFAHLFAQDGEPGAPSNHQAAAPSGGGSGGGGGGGGGGWRAPWSRSGKRGKGKVVPSAGEDGQVMAAGGGGHLPTSQLRAVPALTGSDLHPASSGSEPQESSGRGAGGGKGTAKHKLKSGKEAALLQGGRRKVRRNDDVAGKGGVR